MDATESWINFKKKHPQMLESALGPQVTKALNTITKSGILNRFGGNPNAAQNLETLIQNFVKQAHDEGWNNRENQSLTKIIITERGDTT